MNRLRRWSVVCFVVVAAAGFTAADDQPPAVAKAGEEKWLLDRALTITPRAEPKPALKYRLLPLASELKEGNAVPIYLRMRHEQSDVARKRWTESPMAWNELPLGQIPLTEAHKLMDEMQSRFFQQLDFGARRKSADWNYTLEQPDPLSILLPDAQTMRQYAPILTLRARVQIVEGNFVGAARSFETGFAFSRHVANGPFLINVLIGVAIANQLTDRIPEWIEQPNAPNLYWSLTALPRPLIDLRNQMEFEQRVFEMQFPDLADLDRSRTASEWDATLRRVRTEATRIDPILRGLRETKVEPGPPPPNPNEPAINSPELAEARKFVGQRLEKSRAELAALPPAQVLLLYIHGTFADCRDDLFKITYLSFPEAHARAAGALKRLQSASNGEGTRLAKFFLPAIARVMSAQDRLDRKIAIMRAVEALRLYAAAHDGRLPDSLDQVTAAPVPLDPGTGNPFEYHRDGAAATLASRLPGEPLETTGMRYRLTVRGK